VNLPTFPDSTDRRSWTGKQKKAVFRELYPLSRNYFAEVEADDEWVDVDILFPAAVNLISQPVRLISAGFPRCRTRLLSYFVGDAAQAREELGRIYREFEVRLQDLFKTKPRRRRSRRCTECHGIVHPEIDGNENACEECGTTHCPYCNSDINTVCVHYLGTLGGDDWAFNWFPEFHPLLELGIGKEIYDCTPSAKQAAFGALYPLIEASAKWLPSRKELDADPDCDFFHFLHALVKEVMVWLDAPVKGLYWEGGSLGLASCCTVYFSRRRDDARSQILAILKEFEQSLKRLTVKPLKK
jgi:hypothetical protein